MSAIVGRLSSSEAPSGPLEVPRTLPVRTLSASSLATWRRCRARWKAERIDGRHEPQRLRMTAGKAYGAAIAAYFATRIEGRAMSLSDADDRLLAEFDLELRSTALDEGEDPGAVRERCREPLRVYLTEMAPGVRPLAVERPVEARFPGAEWRLVGYPDIEDERGLVIDNKLGEKHVPEERVHRDVQVRTYLLCRWLEGDPARFAFHSARLGEIRKGPRVRAVPSEPVAMSELALLAFQAWVARQAREIARCAERSEWEESPDGWWCNRGCPAHGGCPAVNLG